MQKPIFAALLLLLAGSADAAIPLLNASCPGNLEVHADQGGPIYVNGKEAQLKRFNDNYYEARSGQVAISLAISPDGSPSVSYTGPGRANGICTLTDGSPPKAANSCPADVSEADRYKYPGCK